MTGEKKGTTLDCFSMSQLGKLANVKFFRGSSDIITSDQLRDEVKKTQELRNGGNLKDGWPESARQQLDVRSLV